MPSFTPDRTARPVRADTATIDNETTFRKDTHMYSAEIRLADIREQHELHRSLRHAERHGTSRGRPIRLRLGESLMRLGRRVGGDTLTTPAWQG